MGRIGRIEMLRDDELREYARQNQCMSHDMEDRMSIRVAGEQDGYSFDLVVLWKWPMPLRGDPTIHSVWVSSDTTFPDHQGNLLRGWHKLPLWLIPDDLLDEMARDARIMQDGYDIEDPAQVAEERASRDFDNWKQSREFDEEWTAWSKTV
jgi:hypothetical protein